jgi:misacylated tRNA(Ala) deacylase
MTERLYMNDCYLKSFNATIEKVSDGYVVLNRTAFYPEGGGQPADHGTMSTDDIEQQVRDVQKEQGEIRHMVDSTDDLQEGQEVEGRIDWDRRYTHMRMHTAQHLLSAVVLDLFNAKTAGNQIHTSYSRMDFNPIQFSDEQLRQIENECNSRIEEEREVTIDQRPRDEVEEAVAVGRTNLDLIPDHIDPLRVVEIEGYDLCPCGGTHVDNLKEIGGIRITERKSKGAETDRLVFELKNA